MTHDHIIVNSSIHFTINPETRVITTPSNALVLVQGDHNSKRYAFEIPKFVEGHDMSLCNHIEIHYDNNTTSGKKTIEGVYIVDDYKVNEDTVVFSWLISGNVTKLPGIIQFWISFTCTDEDDTIIYSWGTDIFNGVKVVANNRNTESVIQLFPDVLEQWRDAIFDEIGDISGNDGKTLDVQISPVQEVHADANGNNVTRNGVEISVTTVNEDGYTEVNSGTVWDGMSGKDGEPGKDYVLTEDDKSEIAELAAGLVEIPEASQNPLIGTTAEVTPAEVMEAMTTGRPVMISAEEGENGAVFNNFHMVGSLDSATVVSTIIVPITQQGKTFHVTVTLMGSIPGNRWNLIQEDITEGGISVTGATVGQTVKISAVDESGTPTSWLPVDFPSVGTGNNVANSDSIPVHIQAEAERVAAVVQSRQNANTITFLACSDIHYYSPDNATTNTNAVHMKEAVVSMGQAMGIIRERCHIDFAAMFGDMVWENGETKDELLDEMRFVNACLHKGYSGIPQFRMEGNHDDGQENGTALTAGELFANIGAWNDNAVYGNREYGYCYRDFDGVKLRVICLNSSENSSGSGFMTSTEQVTWLTNALNLSNKGADWRSIILSHHPLDWGKTGGKDPVDVVKTSTGLIASFHGHIHNFLVGTVTDTELPRIAIPNAGYSRENQYGETYGVNWKESITYSKTPGTADNTSFCVITIDLAAKKIYADHYGAGYTRVLTFDEAELATYTVTNNLTNVRNSNESAVVNEGYAYSATLIADDGYELKSVTVTMGGNPVTVSGDIIDIPNVNGDIVITAAAVKAATGGNDKNLVTTSIDPATGEVYNGKGYKNDVYGSGDGEGSSPDTACVLTGLIAYGNERSDPIYIKGADVTTDSHCRILGFNASKQANFQAAYGSAITTYFTVEKLDDKYYKVTPILSAMQSGAFLDYLRFSLIGEGEDLVITIDEPIE